MSGGDGCEDDRGDDRSTTNSAFFDIAWGVMGETVSITVVGVACEVSAKVGIGTPFKRERCSAMARKGSLVGTAICVCVVVGTAVTTTNGCSVVIFTPDNFHPKLLASENGTFMLVSDQ